jgi:hypothetical protein
MAQTGLKVKFYPGDYPYLWFSPPRTSRVLPIWDSSPPYPIWDSSPPYPNWAKQRTPKPLVEGSSHSRVTEVGNWKLEV